MTLLQLKRFFFKKLLSHYPETEISSFFYILLAHYFEINKVEFALNTDQEIKITTEFENALQDLLLQKPIQYIVGETEFYGLTLKVNNDVLIPRPETEELVDLIIKKSKSISHSINILDIGTGSGCIAVSLAKNLPNARVFALDVSESALSVAKHNAKLHDVDIEFLHKDILQILNFNTQFDIIVSNPPYVRALEKQEIKANVKDYEPHLALFVSDEDPLLFYKAIGQFAKEHLTKTGQLYFEINQYLGKEMIELLKDLKFKDIKLIKDLYGNDRMIYCSCIKLKSFIDNFTLIIKYYVINIMSHCYSFFYQNTFISNIL